MGFEHQHLTRSREKYEELLRFSEMLSDETSVLGKIISVKSIRESSENIQRAIEENLIAHGAAVRLKPYDPKNQDYHL